MKYNIQLHTGAFFHSNITESDAQHKLESVLSKIPVDSVIWGWSSDAKLNKKITDVLKDYGCRSYLWLPVYSEAADIEQSDPFLSLGKETDSGIELSEDEHFEFICPSSRRNLDNALEMVFSIINGNYTTGIFLDRIRYPSAANSANALAGCICSGCSEVYRRYGADTVRLDRCLQSGQTRSIFIPCNVADARYSFADADVDALFSAKREIINSAVRYLSDKIHNAGLTVGVDTFAPILADFVGQDIRFMADHVDLIKPMFYYRTFAPAGVPFEIEALNRHYGLSKDLLEDLWNISSEDQEAIEKQLKPFSGMADIFAPGIEANHIEGICDSSPDYVIRSIEAAGKTGVETVTLSWNISLIPDNLFDILRDTSFG